MTWGGWFTLWLTLALACLATVAYLARDEYEMTRTRNSLLVREAAAGDFDWLPGGQPVAFRQEVAEPPRELLEALGEAHVHQASDELGRALAIAVHMAAGDPPGGGVVQGTTAQAYRSIVERNKGNCADYTQVFNGLSHAAAIPVREWGMSYDGFSGRGHAFSEIYDRQLGKWVFIDSYNSFYAEDLVSGVPLSALELRDALLADNTLKRIRLQPIDADALGFKTPEITIEHYKRGAEQFYLWFGNDVFSYERNALVRRLSAIGRASEQLGAIGLGVHPTFRIAPLPGNDHWGDALVRTRMVLLSAAVLFTVAGTALVVLIVRRVRSGSQSTT